MNNKIFDDDFNFTHDPKSQSSCAFSKRAEEYISDLIGMASTWHHKFNEIIPIEEQSNLIIDLNLAELNAEKKSVIYILKRYYMSEVNIWSRRWENSQSINQKSISIVPPYYNRSKNSPRLFVKGHITLHGMKNRLSRQVQSYCANLYDRVFIDIDLVSAHLKILAGILGPSSHLYKAVANETNLWGKYSSIYARTNKTFNSLDADQQKKLLKKAIYTMLNGGNSLAAFNLINNILDACPEIIENSISSSKEFTLDRKNIDKLLCIDEVVQVEKVIKQFIDDLNFNLDEILDSICTPVNDKFFIQCVDRVEPYVFNERKQSISRVIQGYEVTILALIVKLINEKYPEVIVANLAHDGCLLTIDANRQKEDFVKELVYEVNTMLRNLSKFFFKVDNLLRVEVKTIISPQKYHYDIKREKINVSLSENDFIMEYLTHHHHDVLRTFNLDIIHHERRLVSPYLVFVGETNQWFRYTHEDSCWIKITKHTAVQLHVSFIYNALSKCPTNLKLRLSPVSELLVLSPKHYYVYDESIFETPSNSSSLFFKDGYIRIEKGHISFHTYSHNNDIQMNTWSLSYYLGKLGETTNNDLDLWTSFLNDITKNNVQLRDYLQLAVGYMLINKNHRCDAQFGFEVVGPPSTGKSLFCDLLFDVVWQQLSYRPTADMFSAKGNITNMAFSDISKHRITFISEPILEHDSDAELIKALIGNQRIVTRELYGSIKSAELNSTLLLCSNYPLLANFNHIKGLDRRIKSLPFTNVVDESQRDIQLFDKLSSNPATIYSIIRWSIDGIIRCLNKPNAIVNEYSFDKEVQELIIPNSPLQEFLKTYVIYNPEDSNLRFPESLLIHIFDFFYPNKTSRNIIRLDLKKFLKPYAEIKRGRDGRKYITNIWIKRRYLWTVVEEILNDAQKFQEKKVYYIFKNRSDKHLVYFFLTTVLPEVNKEQDNISTDTKKDNILDELDNVGPYSSVVSRGKSMEYYDRDISNILDELSKYI